MRSLWAQDHISADPGGNNDVRCKSRSTTHLRHMSCPSPLPLVLLLKALAHLPPAGRLRSSEGLEPKAPRTGRGGGADPDHEKAASRHFFGNGRKTGDVAALAQHGQAQLCEASGDFFRAVFGSPSLISRNRSIGRGQAKPCRGWVRSE